MPLLSELSKMIENYRSESLSLDDFVENFEQISRVMFSEDQDLVEACLSVEDSLSRYRNKELDEPELIAELAKAVRPFASPIEVHAGFVESKHSLVLAAAAVIVLAAAPTHVTPHGPDGLSVVPKIAVDGKPSMQTVSATGLVVLQRALPPVNA